MATNVTSFVRVAEARRSADRWKPVDSAGMRHRRDDRHLQLSVCLHAFYPGHETNIYRGALRENSRDILGFHSV